jgi:MurNAc alpha-1-phosphate uridylyltransferase
MKLATTAMVLAAGMGVRMRPLTDKIPKPLVPLAGRALIDHVLDRLTDAGITRAVVNVHYMASDIERHLAHRQRPEITVSDERALLLNTGGGVRRAIPTPSGSRAAGLTSTASWTPGTARAWTRS